MPILKIFVTQKQSAPYFLSLTLDIKPLALGPSIKPKIPIYTMFIPQLCAVCKQLYIKATQTLSDLINSQVNASSHRKSWRLSLASSSRIFLHLLGLHA